LEVPLELVEGETLMRPGSLRSSSGRPYVTYTPFAQAFRQQLELSAPEPCPRNVRAIAIPKSLESARIPDLEDLGLTPNPRVQVGGRRAALLRLSKFIEQKLADYPSARDVMARAATSHLSADLKFGTLSPREILHAVRDSRWSKQSDESGAPPARKFENELFWREFSHSTLWDFPDLLESPHKKEFCQVPWRDDPTELSAFKEGRTGYPIVDAAARQLLEEGYVENRARMIAASFLSKHLMLPYFQGEAHYLKYLVDGDWAQNNFGWQWSAGCGVGAQPYFRMMNPMTQARKFDPDGDYVRRYVPELSDLPTSALFEPWETPPLELARSGVLLGKTYPRPIVCHKKARQRYLATMKKALGSG
jgi:deoxyribodipyrimidine photo-lyase